MGAATSSDTDATGQDDVSLSVNFVGGKAGNSAASEGAAISGQAAAIGKDAFFSTLAENFLREGKVVITTSEGVNTAAGKAGGSTASVGAVISSQGDAAGQDGVSFVSSLASQVSSPPQNGETT